MNTLETAVGCLSINPFNKTVIPWFWITVIHQGELINAAIIPINAKLKNVFFRGLSNATVKRTNANAKAHRGLDKSNNPKRIPIKKINVSSFHFIHRRTRINPIINNNVPIP